MEKFSLKSLLTIVVILLIGITALWQIQRRARPVAAGWFSDSWQYRKAINIGNTSGSNVTNSQVKIFTNYDLSALVTAGKLQADLDDIRFTDSSGNLLKYWIEDATNNSTDVWVLIPNQINGNITILMYYGNPSANSANDNTWVADIGGTNSSLNGYRIHAFKANGTYTNLKDRNAEVLVVAGGGGGAYRHGAGAGAGGLIYNNNFSITNDIGVTIGVGGSGAITSGPEPGYGSNSVFSSLIAIGGGRAGGYDSTNIGGTGGSGGGSVSVNNAAGTSGQGNAGGNGYNGTSPYNWGGGGGAGEAGSNGTATTHGDGGDGLYYGDKFSTTYGENGWFAGGGGGGGHDPGVAVKAIGGSGGGGDGGVPSVNNPGEDAQANTGGGGGGASTTSSGNSRGGNGGSGIVLIRYQSTINSLADILIGTPATEEKSPAPVAYWSFDEGVGTTAYDSSSNRNNGIFGAGTSAPTWQTEDMCVSGKCLKYDGNDYVLSGNNSIYDLTSNFTVSAWVKLNGTQSTRGILAKILDSDVGYQLALDSTGKFIFPRWNAGAKSNVVPTPGTWYHVVGVKNQAGTNSLYINGILQDTTSTTGVSSNTQPVIIGALYSSHNNYFFNGNIDDVKIYAYARTATQIKQDYKAGLAGQKSAKGVNVAAGSKSAKSLSDGLVGYWKMDEATMGHGTTFTDSSGNNNTGTGVSNVAVVSGKFGNGIDIPGVGGGGAGYAVNVADSDSLDIGYTSPMTISFWIYNDSSVCAAIVKKSGLWEIYRCSSAITVRFNQDYTSSYSLNNGQWYLVTVTRDPSTNTTKVYINGQQTDSWTYAIGGQDNSGGMGIGAYYGGAWAIDGKLDEVRIYNRALNPAEITALYEYAPGPVAYYNFEEGVGTTAFDRSGNSNNAVLSVATTVPQWKTGKIGKSLQFLPTQYIQSNNFLNFNNDFTINFWTKGADNSDWRWFLNMNNDGTGTTGAISIATHGDRVRWSYGAWFTDAVAGTTTILNDTSWYYITVGKRGNQTFTYINGIPEGVGTTTSVSNLSLTAPIYIGCGSGQLGGFNSYIDEVKIYNYARTQKQILQDMSANIPVGAATKVSKPIAWYKFDEGQGTIANNSGSIGSILNATLSGNTLPTWTTGKINKGLSLNGIEGVGSVVTTGATLSLTSDVTYTGWFKINSFNDWASVFGNLKYNSGTSSVGINFIPFNGYIKVCSGTGSGNYNTNDFTSTEITTNKWIYGALVYNGSEIKVYINGKLINSANRSSIVHTNTTFTMGRWASDYSGYNFPGSIDEVKIYNYALSADEIKQDYNQGSSAVIGKSNQTIGGTTTSLDYCIPGDASACSAPIGEYKMEEGVGTTTYDTSGNNINAGFSGSPTWTTGKIGNGINFNGTSDFLSNTIKNFYTGTTLEAWVKTTSTDSTTVYDGNAAQNIIGDTTQGVASGFGVHGGKVRYQIYYNTWYNVLGNTSVNDGLWHFISVTHKTSGEVIIYVDGKQDNTGTISYWGFQYNVIGRGYNADYFTGKLDQIRIYNYARTPAQIAYDYNKGAPIGHWKFDECQGNIAYDSSGVGNTGTITIGANIQNTIGTCSGGGSSAWGVGSTGKTNSAINLDGNDDYINITSNLLAGTMPQISVSAWIKNGNSGNETIIATRGWYSGDTGWGWWLLKDHDNKLKFGINTDDNEAVFNQTIDTTETTWYHVVGTYDGATINIYVNGVKGTPYSKTGSIIFGANTYIGRGTYNGGLAYHFNGLIDDVRIYNYALTSEQVKQVYNNGAMSFR